MEIVSAIIGVIIGAWLNNRIQWKINDIVKNLDDFADVVFIIQFYLLKNLENKKAYQETYVNALASFVKIQNIVSGEVELDKIAKVTFENINCYNKNQLEPNNRKLLEESLDKLHICIHNTRREVTTFCYMLKQLYTCIQ